MPVIDEEKIAAAQQEFDEALAGNDAAHELLVAAKAKCEASCGAAAAAVAEAETPDTLETAVWGEEESHSEHVSELEAAYAAVGRLGIAEVNLRRAKKGFGPAKGSNPAPLGVTQLDAAVVVESGVAANEPVEESYT